MNKVDNEYFRLVNLILEEGRVKKNRTGTDTIGVFGAQAKYEIDRDAFPILTTKKVFFKGIVHELLWFISGDTNIKYLVDNDVHIWDEWAYAKFKKTFGFQKDGDIIVPPEDYLHEDGKLIPQSEFIQRIKTDAEFAAKWGELGEGTYGGMWRAFPFYSERPETEYGAVKGVEGFKATYDQLRIVIDTLKFNPNDRRMIVSAWHPYLVTNCALPPCHCLFHFNTEELTLEERYAIFAKGWDVEAAMKSWKELGRDEHQMLDEHCIPRRQLNCLLYQRSLDLPIGGPFNLTSYSLLTAMVAHCVGMEPGTFTWTAGDMHIYTNQLDGIKEQMTRTPKILPKLELNSRVKNLFDFTYDDIKLIGYDPHPAIKMPVAV